MIKMRGGLHGIEMNKYTRRLVLWLGVRIPKCLTVNVLCRADLNCANALASDPIFPACESYNDGSSDYHAAALRRGTNTHPNPYTSQDTNVLADLPTLSKDLTNKFTTLRRVMMLYPDGRSKGDIEKKAHIYSSDEVYLIERGLLVLANLSGCRSIITGCCIAAIIFIDNHMRGIDFLARLMGRLVARLQRKRHFSPKDYHLTNNILVTMGLVLTDLPALAAPITTRRAMFWILWQVFSKLLFPLSARFGRGIIYLEMHDIYCSHLKTNFLLMIAGTNNADSNLFPSVGAIASVSRSERKYFFQNFVELCNIFNIEHSEDAKDVLKKFLWPTAWDTNGAMLWKTVEAARLEATILRTGQTQTFYSLEYDSLLKRGCQDCSETPFQLWVQPPD